MEEKKTLMVTGASGFIGRNFVKRYNNDYNIISVDLRENKPEELDYTGVDTILHLAALVHQMKGAPKEKYFEINTKLTERLAKEAKKNGVKHFVFYSTVKVYGYDGDLYNHNCILNEESKCYPNDFYGKSKLEAENILKELENDDFRVGIIRPAMVYGEGVKGNMENLIKLIKISPVLPFNYDENRRSMVSMDKLLNLTKMIIDRRLAGIYLALDEKNLSIKEIVEREIKRNNLKRLNIRLPKILFKLLIRLKPKIMVRLYGSLQFQSIKTLKKK